MELVRTEDRGIGRLPQMRWEVVATCGEESRVRLDPLRQELTLGFKLKLFSLTTQNLEEALVPEACPRQNGDRRSWEGGHSAQ